MFGTTNYFINEHFKIISTPKKKQIQTFIKFNFVKFFVS